MQWFNIAAGTWAANAGGALRTTIPSETLSIEQEELRGIARTVAEIEWLLLVLVLLYLVFTQPSGDERAAIIMALCFYAAFILSFHYTHFYRSKSRWKIAIESWVMIVFITWVLWYSDKLASPLLNTYLLVIITGALALGKLATLCEMALIAACFVLLGEYSSAREILSLPYVSSLTAQLAPMILVAYVTTMFSADIRYGLNKAKLLSESDELTGLYNRRGFAIIVDRLFAQAERYDRPACFLVIDIDHFKEINDDYGHEAGDRMLRQVAKYIENELRHTDALARYGGDEFVAMLPETPSKNAFEVAGRIRDAVGGTPLEFSGRSIVTSVSIGLAAYPEDGRTLDAIMARADRAMYLAKQAGRNRVVKFQA
jgi:diguanylate cyclase (GGDEF)-like protein